MELNNSTQGDVLERLAEAEKLVVELKYIISQKDAQLQQKDEALQEERKAADNKIKKKIKLHAKAKLTSLNKHLEEMKAQGGVASPTSTEPQPAEPLSKHDKNSTEEEMKVEEIKRELQEKEKLISHLQAQLHQAQSEQAVKLDKSSAEMEEFVLMKQQLQEKEEVISALRTELSQTQAEQAAQKLRVMQRKLEEHEEALLGRAQVVDLLQQELTLAEQRNQTLSQQLQQLEAENDTLKSTMETERQESKILMEKVEFEVAERKLSFHNLQEEMHQLQGQLERSGRVQAELETQYSALEQKYRADMEEKTACISSLQKSQQELRSACDALKEENSELLREKSEQAARSAWAIQQLEDQLQQKSKEIRQFINKQNLQKHETASQTSLPDVCNEGIQAAAEESIASLQKRVMELESEKGALLLGSAELEELRAEKEKLSSRIALLEAQNRAGEAYGAVGKVNTADVTQFSKSNYAEESGQGVPENIFSQKHKELSVLLVEMKEAQEEIAFLKSQLQGKRPDGDSEVPDQKEVKPMESEGALSVTAGDDPSVLSEESSVPGPEREEQASTEEQPPTSEAGSPHDTAGELSSTKLGGVGTPPSVPGLCQCHQDELESLKTQILELETSLHEAKEIYEKNLDEKAKEISSLTQLTEEFKKDAEDAHSLLTTLSEEKEQLLSRVAELDVLPELRARVQELESSLAETEKQRGLDYESQKTQHNLLTEQIHSLSVEAKSKDVKIEALQKELDNVQLQSSQQGTQIKTLQSQLQRKESEVLEGAEHVKDIAGKMEGLSQALSQKELEIAKMDQLLQEKKKDVETLQQTIQEKEQQVTELSFSMTEKMVQLNEEKFSLGVEIKTLKEQLNLLSRAEEAKKEQAGETHGAVSYHNQDEASPAGLMSKEGLQRELELLNKEGAEEEAPGTLVGRKELIQSQ
ncbi:Golgin subfamily B member 1 [Microtus ochrogaster]|uniref:Golgin subfamily B member 1 n=1 Tax=Microtus ochrogaster TaxID=79684 RepID=A0A8J6G0X5_MICOH|nr:Golgin subfamily B member 1 [Microtus ochrogaster]